MRLRGLAITVGLISAMGSAGCSSTDGMFGSSLSTAAIPTAQQTVATAAPKLDPTCVAIQQRIDVLRSDGVVQRAEKAAMGKGQTVQVKRASLAQLAELDKANTEFQARCSTLGPRPVQAAAPIVPPQGQIPAAAAAAAPATAAPVVNSAQVVSASTPVQKAAAAATTPAAPVARTISPPVVVQPQQ